MANTAKQIMSFTATVPTMISLDYTVTLNHAVNGVSNVSLNFKINGVILGNNFIDNAQVSANHNKHFINHIDIFLPKAGDYISIGALSTVDGTKVTKRLAFTNINMRFN